MAKADSKDYILQRTFFLLLTKGYDGVSISDIQQETGMSRGLLYHYFNSKEDLFMEAGKTFLTDLFLIDPEQTESFGLPEMSDYILKKYKELYKSWDQYPGAGKITIANYDFLLYQMMHKEIRMASIYSEMRRKEIESWTKAAGVSLRNGLVRAVLPAEKIAAHYVALLDGIWMQSVEKGDVKQHIMQTKQVLGDYYELLKV